MGRRGQPLKELKPEAPLYAHKLRMVCDYLDMAPRSEDLSKLTGFTPGQLGRWANGESEMKETAKTIFYTCCRIPISWWDQPLDVSLQDAMAAHKHLAIPHITHVIEGDMTEFVPIDAEVVALLQTLATAIEALRARLIPSQPPQKLLK